MKYTKSEALALFEQLGLKERLFSVYEAIPEGHCKGCTSCCSEAVNTFFTEYLHMRFLLESEGSLKAFEKACVSYYLTELVADMKCPLLMENGLCGVYEARPLPCRVYGHLMREDYEENYDQIHENNVETARALKETHNIVVPDFVIHKKIPYCLDFKSEEPMSAEERDDLADLLFSLDSRFLSEDLLDFEDMNFSLVQWFAYDALGREEATRLRVAVAKEISETGNSQTLLQTMAKF